MTSSPSMLFRVLALGLAVGALAAQAAAPTEIAFDGERYLSAGGERDEKRVAENFVRELESLERFSRRITIADLPKATGVRQTGLGIIQLAKYGTPNLEPEVYAAEGAEDRDLTIAYLALTQDGVAVEFHAIRLVALPEGRGVREYHFVAREYTNGRHPDQVLELFAPVIAGFQQGWLDALQELDRAPVVAETPAAPPAAKPATKKR